MKLASTFFFFSTLMSLIELQVSVSVACAINPFTCCIPLLHSIMVVRFMEPEAIQYLSNTLCTLWHHMTVIAGRSLHRLIIISLLPGSKSRCLLSLIQEETEKDDRPGSHKDSTIITHHKRHHRSSSQTTTTITFKLRIVTRAAVVSRREDGGQGDPGTG